ncbi:MAG: hypothetical protein WDA65_08495 [Christensenellales bacterium]
MVKKFVVLGIAFLMLFSVVGLTACENEEENMKTVAFEIASKTTTYFEAGDREQLLTIVKSANELTQLLAEKQISILPIYEASFFETKTLVLYFFTSSMYNDLTLEINAENDVLTVLKKHDMPDGAAIEAERRWTFFIEIASDDLLGISKVEIKQ